jgi:hypothetical protein
MVECQLKSLRTPVLDNVSQTLLFFYITEVLKVLHTVTIILFSLQEATVTNEWAGLRPSRPKVRLERDCISDKYGNTLQVCSAIFIKKKVPEHRE